MVPEIFQSLVGGAPIGDRDYFYSRGNATANPQYSGSWEEGSIKVTSPACAAKFPDGSRFVRP